MRGSNELPRIGGESRSPVPRRLQRMGAVTVGVSLPRDWVGQRGLVPGQSVYLRSLPDGSLLVRDNERARGPSSAIVEVDPTEPGEHLFRRLIGAYLAGATEFVLRQPEGLTPQTRAVARSFARRTGHTESVTEEGTTLLLRDVSMGTGLPVPKLLQRMFQLVHDLHLDAGRSWTRSPVTSTASLAARDDEVDRCAWQIERGLRLGSLDSAGRPAPDLGNTFRFLLWARDLERVGDHAVLIGEHGSRLAEIGVPEPVRRMLSDYHTQALEHLTAANAVAAQPDAVRANELLDVGEALQETRTALADRLLMRDSVERLPPIAIRSLGLILQSIDRTTGYAQNLAEIGLDRDLDRLTRPSAAPAFRALVTPARIAAPPRV